jgi:hypothetical protein
MNLQFYLKYTSIRQIFKKRLTKKPLCDKILKLSHVPQGKMFIINLQLNLKKALTTVSRNGIIAKHPV